MLPVCDGIILDRVGYGMAEGNSRRTMVICEGGVYNKGTYYLIGRVDFGW